jgi:hypothetical protein
VPNRGPKSKNEVWGFIAAILMFPVVLLFIILYSITMRRYRKLLKKYQSTWADNTFPLPVVYHSATQLCGNTWSSWFASCSDLPTPMPNTISTPPTHRHNSIPC